MAMNKVDIEQLLNQAKANLVGVSSDGLKAALYDTMSEFLNDSSIWTQDIIVNAQVGVVQYPLFVPEGQIIRLVGVNDIGNTLPVAGQPINNVSFVPALMAEVGTLTIKNAPNSVSILCVTVVTNVARPVDRHDLPQAPDWLLPVWHVGILDGVLGRLMMEPNKSYSDKVTSAYHLKRFRDAISRARVSKLRANTNGAQAWRFPQSFRSPGQRGGVPAVGGATERSF